MSQSQTMVQALVMNTLSMEVQCSLMEVMTMLILVISTGDETFCVDLNWLKFSSQASGERPINLGNVHNNGTGYLYIELTGSNTFKVRQQSLGVLGDGIGRYDLGQWVHVAYTHDNTLQVTKFYVNGTCVKSSHGNTWTANSTMVVRLVVVSH